MNDQPDALALRLQARPANDALQKALAELPRSETPMGKREAQKAIFEIKRHADNLRRLLMEVRDRGGWKALGYATWAKCCKEEFGYSKRHANRLIQAEEVINRVGPNGPTRPNEPQARELSRLPEDQQVEVWAKYTKECNKTAAMPTAAGLKYRVDQCLKASEPASRNRGSSRQGVHWGNVAVDALKSIPAKDELRIRGFQIVADYIRAICPEVVARNNEDGAS